jgi:type 1 glutamine amidotransferase
VNRFLNISSNRASMRILLCAGPKDHGTDEHDYPLWLERWSRLLALDENVTVATNSGWPSHEAMKEADVIVFYSNNPGWSAAKASELDEFQKRGGGLVYIHFAVDGHDAVPELSERIGLAWRGGLSKFRHGQLEMELPVESPITHGLSRLSLHDESYWDLVGDSNAIQVLATNVEDGKPRPLLWTYQRGEGRVFVSIPGHYTWTFDDPIFRAVLLRGICWAAHRPENRLDQVATIGAIVNDSLPEAVEVRR